MLWITGAAGTGKTTLANYLTQNLGGKDGTYANQSAAHYVCSFFCSRDIEGHHDAKSLLRDLVLQLAQSNHHVLRRIKAVYGTAKEDHIWSFESAWRMFEAALALVPYQCVYIAVDALDECDEDIKLRLFSKFAKTLATMTGKHLQKLKQVKLIISGQPQIKAWWNTTVGRVEHYHINIEDRLITDDIRLFVHVKVKELIDASVCSRSAGERLERSLSFMAESSFLWLNVVLKHIAGSLRYHHDDIEKALSGLPDNLQQAFARYLPRVPEEDVPILRHYLLLMTASSRPLKLREIDLLTRVTSEKAQLPAAEEERVIQGSIQRALGPLVKFPNGTAQFIHSTAKEFFTHLATQPLHELHTSHGVDLGQAHLFSARCCMEYLLHESIPHDLFDPQGTFAFSPSTDSPVSDERWEDDDDGLANLFGVEEVHFFRSEESLVGEVCANIQCQFPAYEYAATSWTYHFVHSQNSLNDDCASMAVDLLASAVGPKGSWYKYLTHRTSVEMPSVSESDPIVLAAMFNFTSVVRLLLNKSASLLTSSTLFVALFWAAARGSFEAAKLLIEYDAPVSQRHDARLPLAVAAQSDHVGICGLILNADGIDPNQLGPQGKPALVLAAEANHERVLRLLLSHSAIQVDQVDASGRTALIAACQYGALDCVRLLRRDGRADGGHVDSGGRSAIHYASKVGDVATMMELMEFPDLDPGLADRTGRNALSIAAQEGHLQVVKLLHRRNVDAARTDASGRNAISWAASSMKATSSPRVGEESVLQYLVKNFPHGADFPDESGWSPLAWALEPPGYLDAVKVLSRCQWVDINRRDLTFGRCLLAWAATSGLTEIVKHLLSMSKVDVNAASFGGRTALSYAAANGMVDTVKLLMQQKDIAVCQPDDSGRIPADWAALNGHLEICDLLRAVP